MTDILLVGCGAWGKFILRDLKQLGCSVCVCAPSIETRAFAVQHGADSAISDLSKAKSPDGIVIAAPTVMHYQLISEALTLYPKTPIFSEKPLTVETSHALDLAARGKDSLFVMDKWRYHGGIKTLGEIHRSGRLGRTLGLRCTRLAWGSEHDDVDPVRILLSHDLSIALDILGTLPEARSASGTWEGDGLTEIDCLLGTNPSIRIHAGARALSRRREVTLYGSTGWAMLPSPEATELVVRIHGGDWTSHEPVEEKLPFSNKLPLYEELRVFVEYVRGSQLRPHSSAQEGAQIVSLMNKLRALTTSAV